MTTVRFGGVAAYGWGGAIFRKSTPSQMALLRIYVLPPALFSSHGATSIEGSKMESNGADLVGIEWNGTQCNY